MAKSKKDTWVLWSEDEVKLLKKLFPRGRAREIADRIGRPLTAVRQRAYNMGLRTRECRRWSAKETELLKKLYPSENIQSIADKLGRSPVAVKGKASKVGLKKMRSPVPWSRQEENLLKKLYPTNSVRDIANRIGRSVGAIGNRASDLGLRKAKPVWSKREVNLLKKLYPSRTAREVADKIGRAVPAVQSRIFKLGFKKTLGYEESHRVVGGVKEKWCHRCKRWKAESEFYRLRRRRDGLAVWCKECATKADKRSHKKHRLAVKNSE